MRTITMAGVALAVSFPIAAQAAPQMLGLPQTAGATPMTCEGGACTVELSAFCLHEDRKTPAAGTVYTPVDGTKVLLRLTRAEGSTVTRSAGKLVTFTSARGHFAVRATLSRQSLSALGAVSAAIEIGAKVSLVPRPVAGDKRPLTKADIEHGAQTLRATAAPLADGVRPDAVAARVMNRAINLLPKGDGTDPRWRHQVWRKAMSATGSRGMTASSRHRITQWQQICGGYPRLQGAFRRCLQRGHDRYMSQVNRDYWKLTGAGS